jgi:hypothetical protein
MSKEDTLCDFCAKQWKEASKAKIKKVLENAELARKALGKSEKHGHCIIFNDKVEKEARTPGNKNDWY